jgi:hypothetical protein
MNPNFFNINVFLDTSATLKFRDIISVKSNNSKINQLLCLIELSQGNNVTIYHNDISLDEWFKNTNNTDKQKNLIIAKSRMHTANFFCEPIIRVERENDTSFDTDEKELFNIMFEQNSSNQNDIYTRYTELREDDRNDFELISHAYKNSFGPYNYFITSNSRDFVNYNNSDQNGQKRIDLETFFKKHSSNLKIRLLNEHYIREIKKQLDCN